MRGFLLFVIILSTCGIKYQQFLQLPLVVPEQGYVLMIPAGASLKSMVRQLAEGQILRYPQGFQYLAFLKNLDVHLKWGEYQLMAGMTHQQLLDLLFSGKVIQHMLTIVEGWTFEQLISYLQSIPELQSTLIGVSPTEIMSRLGYTETHPEGLFFPDTYFFTRGMTDVMILQRAYHRLQEKWQKIWAERDAALILKTPYEALILASIIEKETGAREEYEEIAGVYTRRLERKMRLQADPTVIYGLGAAYPGKLTRALLQQPSPYNTYMNIGLPPTPIALVGEGALRAAVHPKPGKSLYFVATPHKDGRHYFSETYEQHQRAIQGKPMLQ